MTFIHTSIVIYRDREQIISNPTDFPDVTDTTVHAKEIQEPVVKASIIVPDGKATKPLATKMTNPYIRICWRDDGALFLSPSGRS